jgi:hypothetical protein
MPKLTKPALFFIGLLLWIMVELIMAFTNLVHAAPFLVASPYPATAGQPEKAWVTTGSGQIICTLPKAVDGSVTPTCDLASLVPGSYTLVLTVSNEYACATNPDNSAGSCTLGGSASSAPFGYSIKAGAASAPVLSLKP